MTDTLKSISEQCLNLNAPPLNFIPAAATRNVEIIRRDLAEILIAGSLELPKSVVLLAGSLIEAVLYCFLSGQETYIAAIRGSKFLFDRNMSLQNYKEIFNRYFRRAIPGSDLPDFIVLYRDTTHINRELALPEDTCDRAARELLRVLNKLLGDLATFAGPETT